MAPEGTPIRKVVITEFGDVDKVQVLDDVCPPPPADHIQIKTEYTGFSGADVNMRKGFYPLQKKAPLTPGYCLVGTVNAVGESAKEFKVGDVVAVLTKYDAEAELVNQPEKYCIPVPEGVDHKQACAILTDWNTAYGMVVRTAKVQKGQKVFVHGMSGAVGTALMVISKLQGAEVYGTASERNHEEVKKFGGNPFVYSNKDWIKAITDLGGVDAVFDPLGYESFDESYSILNSTGILVAYGNNKGSLENGELKSPLPALLKLFARNLNPLTKRSTTFFGLTRDSQWYKPNVTTLFDLVKNGTITVPIKTVWDMEDIQTAHRNWGGGSGVGSLLIKVAKD
ncbi:protein indc11 [Hypoxylon trugodes]|uniref:protein indc11 n=1 Tax=Hypoxylon trugodes TaxID=326681 RepID=UPI0021949D19|nr:protein indc11 [Hypoxylon trugodes]KAI1391899.1 protein indc11 [Hypoxylon trugodes]